jgi:Xaa-Pro aminopeptidase
MVPLFARSEYVDLLERVRIAMQVRKIDVLVVGDPANIYWLSGYDAWSGKVAVADQKFSRNRDVETRGWY